MKILIVGSLSTEINLFFPLLKEESPGDSFSYYLGKIGQNDITVCQTGVGLLNASAKTSIMIEKFHPDLILNIGTAGSHVDHLDVGDIVLGTKVVYMDGFMANSLQTEKWEVVDDVKHVSYGNKDVIQQLLKYQNNYRLFEATLGSSDIFTTSAERIDLIHSVFKEDTEDMESSAVSFVADLHNVPCLCVRAISNNEYHGTKYEDNKIKASELVQKLVLDYLNNTI